MANSATTNPTALWGLAALEARRKEFRDHQAQYAPKRDTWIKNNKYFYNEITRLLRFIVEPHRKILDIRCQTGFLMDALKPSKGVGVELTPEMAAIAERQHPQCQFLVSDPETIDLNEKFDYVLIQNVSDTVDVQETFRNAKEMMNPESRLIIYTYNPFWKPILLLAEKVGFKMPMPEQNWLTDADLRNLLNLAGFDHLRTYRVVLFPKWIPGLSWLFNRLVSRIPLIDKLCMINVLVARPDPKPIDPNSVTVSVIVPCKNEQGNIEPAIHRIPDMGGHTEIIFCDDKSDDGTADEVRRMQAEFPHRDIRLVDGPGICKSKNVWTGFRAAKGDILMILDADLTVIPEELPLFFQAMVQGKGEFINGSRMVYPMQRMAMKFTNMLGNKFFSMAFTYLLGQPIKDTLCGTKVIWRKDWQRLEPFIDKWGVEDRWGDYELLFGASKLHLKIVDLPVHYQERTFGTTKMVRVFRNGMIMLKMCAASFFKLKLWY